MKSQLVSESEVATASKSVHLLASMTPEPARETVATSDSASKAVAAASKSVYESAAALEPGAIKLAGAAESNKNLTNGIGKRRAEMVFQPADFNFDSSSIGIALLSIEFCILLWIFGQLFLFQYNLITYLPSSVTSSVWQRTSAYRRWQRASLQSLRTSIQFFQLILVGVYIFVPVKEAEFNQFTSRLVFLYIAGNMADQAGSKRTEAKVQGKSKAGQGASKETGSQQKKRPAIVTDINPVAAAPAPAAATGLKELQLKREADAIAEKEETFLKLGKEALEKCSA
jgi:hypothetical protein